MCSCEFHREILKKPVFAAEEKDMRCRTDPCFPLLHVHKIRSGYSLLLVPPKMHSEDIQIRGLRPKRHCHARLLSGPCDRMML